MDNSTPREKRQLLILFWILVPLLLAVFYVVYDIVFGRPLIWLLGILFGERQSPAIAHAIVYSVLAMTGVLAVLTVLWLWKCLERFYPQNPPIQAG